MQEAFAALRRARVSYLLVNGLPGFNNVNRFYETAEVNAWSYRRFDPAGRGLGLKLLQLFLAREDQDHPGVWGLYEI